MLDKGKNWPSHLEVYKCLQADWVISPVSIVPEC